MRLVLDDIQNKLKEIDENTFYGMVDNSMKNMQWNYIVFDRGRISRNSNKTGYTYSFNVHVVRENFIPEGLEVEVIDKMEEIAGIRFSGNDGEYTYVEKPNTNKIVEMVSLEFVKPVKV